MKDSFPIWVFGKTGTFLGIARFMPKEDESQVSVFQEFKKSRPEILVNYVIEG